MGSAPPIDDFIHEHAPHVVVLEVCAMATGTSGEPPRVRVRIIDVLRGSLSPGEQDAVFSPRDDDSWYAIRGGGDAGLARWRTKALVSPTSGERVIVAGDLLADDALLVWARSIRPDAEAERTRLRALLRGGA